MSLPTGVIRLELESGPVVTNGQKVEDTLNRIATKSESTGKKMEMSTKLVATSLLGLGTAAFSAYQGFDQLEKIQLRSEKAALAVARAQKQVNDMEKEGKQGTEAYAIATEKLRIAQEQAAQSAQDVTQQTVQLGLSLGTTGFTMATTIISLRGMAAAHTTAAGAATVQTAANAGLTLSFRGLTAAMMSNPLGLALVAGSIGALAIYQTNLLGVKDKVDNLIDSFSLGKQPIQDLHSEFNQGIDTTRSYTSSLKDLNSEYQNTIDILKKNDEIKQSYQETLFFMGSLQSMTHDFIQSGVLDVWSLLQKDTRILPRSKEVIEKLRRMKIDAIVEEEQLARVLGFKDRREFEKSLFTEGGIVKALKPDFKISALGGGLGMISRLVQAHGNSLSSISNNELMSIQNLGASRLANLRKEGFGPGAIATTLGGRIGSTTAKGKSAKHGGQKGPTGDVIAIREAFNTVNDWQFRQAQNSLNQMMTLAASEGIGTPSGIIGFDIGMPRYDVYKRVISQIQSAAAEATRRRNERIAQQTVESGYLGISLSSYQSMLQSEQGMIDIAGMKLYKQLASLG